jgi:hypothetical protein
VAAEVVALVKGWSLVVAGGLAMGALASFPALDGVLWRLAVRGLPWIGLAVLLAAVVVGAAWAWKRWSR